MPEIGKAILHRNRIGIGPYSIRVTREELAKVAQDCASTLHSIRDDGTGIEGIFAIERSLSFGIIASPSRQPSRREGLCFIYA